MKNVNTLILMLLVCYGFLQSADFDIKYDCGGTKGGVVSFDSNQNLWFTSETGLFFVEAGTDKLQYVNVIKAKNADLYMEYNGMTDETPPVVSFRGNDMIIGCKQGIYLMKDSVLHELDFGIDFSVTPEIYQIYYSGEKDCYIDLVTQFSEIGFTYYGLFKLDMESLAVKQYKYGEEGRGDPNYFGGGQKLYKFDDKIYYPTWETQLTSFNDKETEITDLKKLIPDTNSFNSMCYSFFKNGKMYFTGGNEVIYDYDLETGNLKFEDLRKSRMYYDHIKSFNKYAYTNIRLIHKCEDYDLARVVKPYAFDHLYIRPTGDDDFSRVDIDTAKYKDIYGVTVDKENNIWLFIKCIDEATNWPYIALVSFDPLTKVSVEQRLEINTNITSKLYPNPAKRAVTLEYCMDKHFSGDVYFTVYDCSGRKIRSLGGEFVSAGASKMTKQFDVSSYASGSYYVVIDNGIEKQSVSFVVE